MYYNTRTGELLIDCPLNGYFEDGTLVQGLDIADAETQKLCGILPVTSDTPDQPENTTEDVSRRIVAVENDGVAVTRTYVPTPVVVPSSISPRQIRLWLVSNGIALAGVDSAIDAIADETLREKTKIEWEFSPYIERNHPMIGVLGASLGLSDAQIDQAFIAASGL